MSDRNQPGRPGQNTGHGHVYPRPDRVRMRCGGPAYCALCGADASRKQDAAQRQQLVPLAAIGGTCDWGACNSETTALRWWAVDESWLPVCAEHETGTKP